MIVKISKMFTKVTDFVEPWNFARRAPQDEEMEESASHHAMVLLMGSNNLSSFDFFDHFGH